MLVYHKNSKSFIAELEPPLFYGHDTLSLSLIILYKFYFFSNSISNLSFNSQTIFRSFTLETLQASEKKRGRKKIRMERDAKPKAVGLTLVG